jgi:hypothetical protein
MRREIRRLQIEDGIHLEGIGVISSTLPMQLKSIPMKMYYDTTYPSMIIIEAKNATHFISLATLKSGTFDDEPDGNVI